MDKIGIWNLKIGDNIKLPLTRGGKTSEEVLTYNGMDGGYARLLDKNRELVNMRGYVKKEGEFYIPIDQIKDG